MKVCLFIVIGVCIGACVLLGRSSLIEKYVYSDKSYTKNIKYKASVRSWGDLDADNKKKHINKSAKYIVCKVINCGNKRCYVEFAYKHGLFKKTIVRTDGGLPPNMSEWRTFVVECDKAIETNDNVKLEIKHISAK